MEPFLLNAGKASCYYCRFYYYYVLLDLCPSIFTLFFFVINIPPHHQLLSPDHRSRDLQLITKY